MGLLWDRADVPGPSNKWGRNGPVKENGPVKGPSQAISDTGPYGPVSEMARYGAVMGPFSLTGPLWAG